MAQQFIRKTSQNLGSAVTAIGGYTVPQQTSAVLMGITLANITVAGVKVTVELYDGINSTRILKDAEIPPGTMLAIRDKINLQASDSIRVKVSADNAVDAVMSVLERS